MKKARNRNYLAFLGAVMLRGFKKPKKPENGYNEYIFKISKKYIGKTVRAYKVMPFSDDESDSEKTE